jgi:hypothetical protein
VDETAAEINLHGARSMSVCTLLCCGREEKKERGRRREREREM